MAAEKQPLKQSLKEAIDEAALVLLQKSRGSVTLSKQTSLEEAEQRAELLREHVSAFAAVVSWYKIRGGAAADETPKESTFERIKSDFRAADGAPGRRRGSARKSAQAAAGEPADASEPDPDDL